MFKVTQKEENAVMRIQGVYTSLQLATDKVARSLLFDPAISSASQKSIFNFGSERRKEAAAQKEKVKLLEVLTVLKAEVEACLPTIVNDRLSFKCRLVDEYEFDTDRFRVSEAKSAYDMVACLDELERRMSKILAFPEVAEVVANSANYAYCPSLAVPDMGISQIAQTYVKELKEEEATRSDTHGIPNPNTSRRKQKNRCKSKKNGKKHP